MGSIKKEKKIEHVKKEDTFFVSLQAGNSESVSSVRAFS